MEKILHTKTLCQANHLAITWVDIDFGNGKQGRFEIASFVGSDIGGVIIAAYDESTEEVIMIEQFQVGYGKRTLLLPRWGKKEHCSSLASAQEELLEETGYESADRVEMSEIYSSPGFFSQRTTIYIALNPKIADQCIEGDEVEETLPMRVRLTDVLQKIMDGTIIDARTICGIFILNQYLTHIRSS